jgi:protein-tyrosine-phosphatase
MEKLNAEKAVAILRKQGVDISVEQAAQMLELLRKFANIIVSQHLESQKQHVLRKAI